MEYKYRAYLYWYRPTIDTSTQYVWVIAVSEKQANFFWFRHLKHVIGWAYDYDIEPTRIIKCNHEHDIGDILGDRAKI